MARAATRDELADTAARLLAAAQRVVQHQGQRPDPFNAWM